MTHANGKSEISGRYEDLKGKVALITGGSTGIGLAAARELAKQGAHVFVAARGADDLEKAKGEILVHAAPGTKVVPVICDVAKSADLDALMESVRKESGGLDVIFINAGIAHFLPLENVDEAFYERQFAVNVKGALFTLQKSLGLLRQGSSVVFNTSVVNHKGFPGTTVYSATKAALRSLVRTAAAELAPRKIRVNAVSPGPIETPIFSKMGMGEKEQLAMAEGFAAQVPLARFGRPEEVASAVAFFASGASSFITGVELDVDGGLGQI